MNPFRTWPWALVSGLASLVSTAVQAAEEPPYALLRSHDSFELRRYEPYLVAEVVVPGPADRAGDQGFSILGDYIFGKNKGARKIDMTAPVTQTAAPVKIDMTAPVTQAAAQGGGFLVQFVMPRSFTLQTLPEPVDSRVRLSAVSQQDYAVIRYSGGWSQARYDENLARLRAALQQAGIATQGEPVFSRYNAPFVPPFLRRNEIWLRVP